MKIPEDISIVGYFDTPWCEVLEPNLTSVSIREKELAEQVIKQIISGKNKKEKIFLKPKLVIRDSCLLRMK